MFIIYFLLPVLFLILFDVILEKKKVSLKYFCGRGFLLSALAGVLFCYAVITVTHLSFTAALTFTPMTLFVAACSSAFFAVMRLMIFSFKDDQRTLSLFMLSLCLALFLEGFIFNMRFYQTYYYEPTDLTDKIGDVYNFNAVDGKEGLYTSNSSGTVYFEFDNINEKIHNVHFDLRAEDVEGNVMPITVNLRFTDESNENYLSVPSQRVAGDVESTKYLYLVTSGVSDRLSISFSSDGSYYTLGEVAINVPREFSFNTLRFLLTLIVVFLSLLLRPSSKIYEHKMTFSPKQQTITTIAIVLEMALLVVITLFNPVFEMFASSHHAQYNQLAEAFINGKLHLEIEPPAFLAQMENPYDYVARTSAAAANGSTYYWDAAYYNGHYYVYFGVLPVLLFYLPFKLITGGADLPNRTVIQICLCLFVIGSFLLIEKVIKKYFRPERIPYVTYLALTLIFINASGAVFIAKRPDFYSIPIILSMALVAFGLYFWMRSTDTPAQVDPKFAFAGSLCMALVAACRPQFLLVSAMAIVIFWDSVFRDRSLFSKKGIVSTVAICLPYAIVALPLMCYNYARFGSPFDFGQNYNLTTNDMTGRGFRFERVGLALFTYFFQPPNLIATFPFVSSVNISTAYLGRTITEAMFGGIFLTIPLLWILIKLPALKKRLARKKLLPLILLPLALSVFTGVFDAQGAGLLQRYVADFAYLAIFAAIILILFLYEHSRGARTKELNAFTTFSLYSSGTYCFLIMFAIYGTEIYYHNYSLFARAAELIQFWK